MKAFLRFVALGCEVGTGLVVAQIGVIGFLLLLVAALLELYMLGSRGIARRALANAVGQLLRRLGAREEADLRCTIYVPTMMRRRWAAFMPYCGSAERPPRRFGLRRLKPQQGIVGACVRHGEKILDVLTEEQQGDRLGYLVRNWGFTKKEAARMSLDRDAYGALPIPGGRAGSLLGVVYMDAKGTETLTPELVKRFEDVIPFVAELVVRRFDRAYD